MRADLDTAINDYIAARRASGIAKNTIRNDHQVLRHLMAHTGNILLKSVTDTHVTNVIGEMAERRSQSSLNVARNSLRGFFKWAHETGRLKANPAAGLTNAKIGQKVHRYVPPEQFEDLLQAAEEEHPRDRAVVALGIYTFLRGSEIADLRVEDVDLDEGWLTVRIFKSNTEDRMPISEELDAELRRWLTWYSENHTPIQGHYRLVPAKKGGYMSQDPETGLLVYTPGRLAALKPECPVTNIHKIPQRALLKVGWMTEADKGEGIHTLRRSSGLAWYEVLRPLHPDAKEIIRTAFHHKDVRTTVGYLGLETDKQRRNEAMRGKMYRSNDEHENVTPLRRSDEQGRSGAV